MHMLSTKLCWMLITLRETHTIYFITRQRKVEPLKETIKKLGKMRGGTSYMFPPPNMWQSIYAVTDAAHADTVHKLELSSEANTCTK